MINLNIYTIVMGLLILGLLAENIYSENQKTERYRICIKELKDIEGCKKSFDK